MKTSRSIWIAFALNLFFALLEFLFGVLFRSSAVLADAIHDTGDAVAIGLSAFLEKLSNKKEDKFYTFGYKRFSLLGAMITATILISGSVFILLENIPKLFRPEKVNDNGMFWLGIFAILINGFARQIVLGGNSRNEAVLSLHFLEDILGWLAVIVVSLLLKVTNWYFLDPLLSVVIALFILSKAVPKFCQQLAIFLEKVPEGIDIESLKSALLHVENISEITQLNIWTMDGLEHLATLHVCLDDWQLRQSTKLRIHQLFKTYGVTHLTIEVDKTVKEHQVICKAPLELGRKNS